MVLDKTIIEWCEQFTIMNDFISLKETFWLNPNKVRSKEATIECHIKMADIIDASQTLERFAPYIATVYPETAASAGIIESPLEQIPLMQHFLEVENSCIIQGKLLLKCDSKLPISGSIKARGGIYEVLKHAESIAIQHNMLKKEDNYAILAEERFKKLFSQFSIAVGSTGNLGLSIGIMGAMLGFHVSVHMSADARQWKKDILRSKGVNVVEYEQDYSKAVEEGRKQSENDTYCYFVDDENSKNLFLGYAVAALRLQKQLEENGIIVDKEHPLFVYLPCGVGGEPGGVAFGIKQVYGDAAHCFFAEPTHSPCMTLGLATGYHDKVCVQDFGIDNLTAADGLAVGRASSFVGKIIEPFLSGSYTISDENMYHLLSTLIDIEKIALEPSALAGMIGPVNVVNTIQGKEYLDNEEIKEHMKNATHLVWATGGNMVPKEVMKEYYQKGKNIKNKSLHCF